MEPNIVFLNLGQKNSKAIPSGKVLINFTNGGKYIRLNREITDIIKEGKYIYLRVGFSPVSTDAYFVFGKKQEPDSMALDIEGKTIYIRSKYIMDKLVEKLSLKTEPRNQHLNISRNLSNSSEYLTYRISK